MRTSTATELSTTSCLSAVVASYPVPGIRRGMGFEDHQQVNLKPEHSW